MLTVKRSDQVGLWWHCMIKSVLSICQKKPQGLRTNFIGKKSWSGKKMRISKRSSKKKSILSGMPRAGSCSRRLWKIFPSRTNLATSGRLWPTGKTKIFPQATPKKSYKPCTRGSVRKICEPSGNWKLKRGWSSQATKSRACASKETIKPEKQKSHSVNFLF